MILDLHVDPIILNNLFGYRIERRHRPGVSGQPLFWHSDLPRMREAGYGGVCLGIHWWPWESERGWQSAVGQIEYLDEVARETPKVERVRVPEDWREVDAEPLAVAPGVEGAHILNGELGRVERLADLDATYLTLAHFSKNSACTPSVGRGANESQGLTPFGRDLVVELERHGLTVDVAHVNTPGVLDACRAAEAPVLCTHTGVRGVHDAARNITDEEVDAIAETDGVVGIIFAPVFLAGEFVEDSRIVVDHMEYVADRVGVEHVAVGSDYDGWIPTIPSDQRDCRDIDRVEAVLRDRGWPADDIEAVMGGNAMEVLSGARG